MRMLAYIASIKITFMERLQLRKRSQRQPPKEDDKTLMLADSKNVVWFNGSLFMLFPTNDPSYVWKISLQSGLPAYYSQPIMIWATMS